MEVERKAQIEGGVAVHPEFSRAVREQLPPPTVVPFPKSPPSLLLPWVSPRLSACLPPTRVHTPAPRERSLGHPSLSVITLSAQTRTTEGPICTPGPDGRGLSHAPVPLAGLEL